MYDFALLNEPVMKNCQRFWQRHKPLTHRQWLDRMAERPEADLAVDFFDYGPLVDQVEGRLAEILGHEKVILFHKGMVAQLSALLCWSELHGSRRFALHPSSHLQVDEQLAYSELCRLDPFFLGQPNRAVYIDEIQRLPSDLATVSLELPIRRAGFLAPDWSTLQFCRLWCNQNDVSLHFDGARIWEVAPHYRCQPYELAVMADSIYVSLYKSLGACSGGALAGSKAFLKGVQIWKTRFGGNLQTVFPMLLTTLWGLDHYLPRMQEFYERAIDLASEVSNRLGLEVTPVHSNSFVINLPLNADLLRKKVLLLAEMEKIWLFDRISSRDKNSCQVEFQVGDALDDWTQTEVVQLLSELLDKHYTRL